MNRKALKTVKIIECAIVLAINIVAFYCAIFLIRYSVSGDDRYGLIYFFIGVIWITLPIPILILCVIAIIKISMMNIYSWKLSPFIISASAKFIFAYELFSGVIGLLGHFPWGMIGLLAFIALVVSMITDIALSKKLIRQDKTD